MAKRVKGESEEKEGSYEFMPPDFDEDAFIHKEMTSFRTTSTLIMVGIVAAAISALLFGIAGGQGTGWFVGLGIFALSFATLRPLFRALKFDISHYGRREWLGNGLLLFFAWLAFFMIALNPPISDYASPHVAIYASPSVVEVGEPFSLDIFLADNDRFDTPLFSIVADNGTMVAEFSDLVKLDKAHYRYSGALPAGSYTVTASTTDPAGLIGTHNLTLGVVADVVNLHLADLADPTEELFVQLPTGLNVYAVYADMDGKVTTTQDRVYFELKEDRGGWEATANYKGWSAGTNNFTIMVEEKNRFEAQTIVPGGILRDGPHSVEVTNPGEYSKGQPKSANPTNVPSRQVPGLELPILIGGLVAVAFVARRRQ